MAACLPAGELISTATPCPTLTPSPTFTATPGPTDTATPMPTTTPTTPPLLIHVVESGDNLWDIAAYYGVSVDDIAEANAMADAHYLRLGQELVIPLEGFDPNQPGALLTALPAASSQLCSGLDVHPAHEASRYLGQFVCVEFRVASTQDTDIGVYLSSPDVGDGPFRSVVVPEWQDCWAEGPERRFLDRRVRVRGTVEQHLGMPQIILGDCAQIELVPSIGP